MKLEKKHLIAGAAILAVLLMPKGEDTPGGTITKYIPFGVPGETRVQTVPTGSVYNIAAPLFPAPASPSRAGMSIDPALAPVLFTDFGIGGKYGPPAHQQCIAPEGMYAKKGGYGPIAPPPGIDYGLKAGYAKKEIEAGRFTVVK